MKKVIFIVSHFCSGSYDLVETLNRNSRIQITETDYIYTHPTDVMKLTQGIHKCNNSAAIYGAHLLRNVNFSCKRLYGSCKFIYVIRGADAIKEIAKELELSPDYAARHYCYRLQRICEMAHKTLGAALLTYDQLVDNQWQSIVESYLELKEPLDPFVPCTKGSSSQFPIDLLEKSQDSYERHLFYLKNQNLRLLNAISDTE